MNIRETTLPAPRRFEVELLENELEELQIAFNHMLGISFYCDTQRERVRAMRDKILKALRP